MRLKLPDNQMPDDGNMLKRRLLGAAVLIAVAVIALPLLLDGAGSESRFRRVEQLRQEPPRIIDSRAIAGTPPKPTEKPAPEPAPESVAAQKSADSTSPALSAPKQVSVAPPVTPGTGQPVATAETATTAAKASESPKSAAAQSSEVVDQVAWIVQAGSYSAEDNANALRARLRAAGFPSFVSKGSNQGAAVFRVKVGPLNNRQQAARVQSDVESLLGQSTLIRKYP